MLLRHTLNSKLEKLKKNAHIQTLQLNEIMLHSETKRFDAWNFKRIVFCCFFFSLEKETIRQGTLFSSTKRIEYSMAFK